MNKKALEEKYYPTIKSWLDLQFNLFSNRFANYRVYLDYDDLRVYYNLFFHHDLRNEKNRDKAVISYSINALRDVSAICEKMDVNIGFVPEKDVVVQFLWDMGDAAVVVAKWENGEVKWF